MGASVPIIIAISIHVDYVIFNGSGMAQGSRTAGACRQYYCLKNGTTNGFWIGQTLPR